MAVLGAHRPIRPLGALLLAILVAAAPLAASLGSGDGWRSSIYEGNTEPGVGDPVQARGDFDPEGMWQDANDGSDGEPVQDRIYLDGVMTSFVHPRIPAPKPTDTAPRNYVVWYAHATLGAWRDCNQDGFIGDAVTGAIHYASSPLVDTKVCPVGSPYNDGTTVSEQLVVGPGARDLSTSGGDKVLCPERTGGPSDHPAITPRAQEERGVAEDGDNVACFGGSANYIQDDLAKVWMDFGLPTDGPEAPGVGVFPFPDGTLRDTNGHFRYLDVLLTGQLSLALPGLWPAPAQHGDPAPGNQCEETNDGLDAPSLVANAQAGASRSDCSPVPNIRYLTVPAVGPVAWPGHLAEDRFNDSESPNERGTPITEPFDQAGPDGDPGTADDCKLRSQPSSWDGEPDPDPIRGYTLGSTDLGAYLGPGDDGPSVEPTLDVVLDPLLFNVQRAVLGSSTTPCQGEGGTLGHPLEESKDLQAPLRARSDATFSFLLDAHMNPNTAPGEPLPQANVCTPRFSLLFGLPHRCGGVWQSSEQWHSVHGVTDADPDVTESMKMTFYADVSFGPDGFDPVGDDPFDPEVLLFETPSWPELTQDPQDMLPAGSDDAHQYGDEQCDSITMLSVPGTDVTASGTVTAVASAWSCDRNKWVQIANLDCATEADELSCMLLPKVGDGYDLRDIDCYDNDVLAGTLGSGTTDSSGPIPGGGPAGTGHLAPGEDCDAIDPARLPDL